MFGVRTTAAIFALSGAALAGAPDGYVQFYDAPTRVNMGGRPVVADIALYANTQTSPASDLEIALITDVSKFIDETQRDLENWIATHRNECGERWAAGDPVINFPQGAIRFALELEYEYWNCGWNGKSEPWRAIRETGNIDVTIVPEIIDGKLQARLGAFSIDQRTGVNRYLPMEFVTRRILTSELAKLNQNPKFYRAPQPFQREGFTYQSIAAERDDDRIVITALYKSEIDNAVLERLIEELSVNGIVSER